MFKEDDIPQWAIQTVEAILQTVRLKDPFTFHHCCRVGRAARRFARDMGLTEQEQNILEFSGLLHDIGKVGVSESILLKPDRLTDEEMTEMKSHADMSCEIIEPLLAIPFFRFLIPGVRYHHERFDGKGYPYNLAGENIPLPARMIAIVDTVDAMTHTRPYRQALSMEKARQELVDFSGTQFDGHLVQIYLEVSKNWKSLDEGEADERIVTHVLEPKRKISKAS